MERPRLKRPTEALTIERAALHRPLYVTSHVKRARSTKEELERRRAAMFQIVETQKPMTVRQVFYQATVKHLAPKTEKGYWQVWRDLTDMRKSGEMPYEWLVDNTRRVLQPLTFDSPSEALEHAAERYRKSLWTDEECRVHVWLEKDALSSIIRPITFRYDVPLMVARGYSSLSFLHEVAEDIKTLDVPLYIYHLGDFDPSGVNAGEKIEETLREMAPGADIIFQRLAVTPEQIEEWELPSRPTKTTDSRAAAFGDDESVELDAIPPQKLRDLVEETIQEHMPPERYAELLAEQSDEQTQIRELVDEMGDTA